MLKNKFQRLEKKEKKKAIENYYKTDVGKANKSRFLRLLIIGIACFLYSTYLIVDAIVNDGNIWYYIMAGFVIAFGLVFLIGRHKIMVKSVNNYLIKNKK